MLFINYYYTLSISSYDKSFNFTILTMYPYKFTILKDISYV